MAIEDPNPVVLEDPRPITVVLKDIVGNLQHIIRAEIRLAQAEVRDEVSKVARAGILIGAGGLFGLLAFGFILLAAVFLLAKVVALWLAATIVAVAVGAVGAVLMVAGKAQLKRVSLPPPKTVTTLQENIRWAKAHSN
jgi:hypothetical protein